MTTIDESVKMGKNVQIGEGVILQGNITVGDNVILGNHCVIRGSDDYPTSIGDQTTIGDCTSIHQGVHLAKKCIVDERVTLGRPSKKMTIGQNPSDICSVLKEYELEKPCTIIGQGSVIRAGTVIYLHTNIGRNLNTGHNSIIREHIALGNNCVVGGVTEMDGYTKVGDGTIISQLVVTCQAMSIGNGCFLGGFLSFSENKYSIPGKISCGPQIGDFVRIGTGSSLMADTIIGDYSIIGAHSLVTKSVPEKSVAFGLPAKVIRTVTKNETDEYVHAMKKRINMK